jgi:DNA-binding transcriptional LysR family regulator
VDLNPVRARCFLEVVERGTVAAAARALGYTAPAVSQQVAKLERSLGVPLFDRVSGRLRPTPAGTALVPHVYAVLDALESGRESARTAARSGRQSVGVAAFPSALVNVVAPVAGAGTAPIGRVVEVEDDDALRDLSLGHVDVAIVQEHSHQQYERVDRFAYHRLLRDPLDLLVPPGHPAPARFAATGDLPWVVSGPGSPCRTSTEQAWLAAGIAPTITGEAYELASLVALVACSVGVALLPRLGLPADLQTGGTSARVVPGVSPVVRTLYAVTRRTHARGAVAQVVAALRAQAKVVGAREAARWAADKSVGRTP